MFRRRIILLPALALAACDVPTQPPMWEQTWAVEGEAITIGVAELLPSGVDLNADSTAFVATVPGVDMTLVLSDMCPTCSAADGLLVPKPAIDYTFSSTTSLPADLVSASLAGGSFDVILDHSFNFDPLRPSSAAGAERGFLTLTISSNGNTVADTTIHGDDTDFPSTVTLTPTLAIAAVDVTNTLDVDVRVYSPAGDPVVMDSSDSLRVAVQPAAVEISEATVVATGIPPINAQGAELDFSGVDPTIVDRIRGGALTFDVQNPFTVTGSIVLEFDMGTQTVTKPLNIQQGAFQATLDFSETEMQAILGGDNVVVNAVGTLSAVDGTLTVSPAQELIMDTQMSLTLLVGGTEEDL